MPIKTVIHANTDKITTIQIARIRGMGMKPGDINEYAVVESEDETWFIDWDNAPAKFTHVYGDGVNMLVAKGIIALEETKRRGKK